MECLYPVSFIQRSSVKSEGFQEEEFDPMAWTKLKYSKEEINSAGRTLLKEPFVPQEYDKAIDVINNFRACHGFPLLNFRMRLRWAARKVYPRAIVAQRIKRITSITQKLVNLNDMTLYRMQDIAGCRAIVETVSQVRKLRSEYYMPGKYGKHVHLKVNDYISKPKATGYRSLHIIYEYRSEKNKEHNGRKIEIQLRTKFQHYWATAVEVAGTIIQQPLKSNIGSEDWLEFFRLVGSAFAMMEKSPGVPGVTTEVETLKKQIRDKDQKLAIADTLSSFGGAFHLIHKEKTAGYYFVLWLNPAENVINVYSYGKNEHSAATEHVAKIEKENKENPNSQVILAVTDDLKTLKRAYPNYFVDTELFLAVLDKFLKS